MRLPTASGLRAASDSIFSFSRRRRMLSPRRSRGDCRNRRLLYTAARPMSVAYPTYVSGEAKGFLRGHRAHSRDDRPWIGADDNGKRGKPRPACEAFLAGLLFNCLRRTLLE